MIDTVSKKLVALLLEKYERSSSFRTGILPKKKIQLRLYDNGQGDVPEYNIEQSDKRITINECVLELAKRGMVGYAWMRGEENHILSRVWLCVDHLAECYALVGREPQREHLAHLEEELCSWQQRLRTQWMQDYLKDACQYMHTKKKIPALVPTETEERQSLLKALSYIDNNENGELLKRIFSIRCFGDSKHFERVVEHRLLRILRKYMDLDEETTNEQLLNQLGIAKYPEEFAFCGPLLFVDESGRILSFTGLKMGSVIYGQDVLAGQLTLDQKVRQILTIENKANYFDYIDKHRKPDELVIYHGGQYSPAKKVFLRKIAKIAEKVQWYHWGDIDYGGFTMLARLRREINSAILPHRMNKEELVKFAEFATSFPTAYGEKLRGLLGKEELSDCQECLTYMLEHNRRLEQEALLE